MAAEEEEKNDWAGVDAMHEMIDAIRPELNLSSEDRATPEVERFFFFFEFWVLYIKKKQHSYNHVQPAPPRREEHDQTTPHNSTL